jgi:ssDNA thymidine ADP-ribosyltransferase, DarT
VPPPELTLQKALIFRIVHRDNVPWILDNGLHCKNSKVRDPNFVEIGNKELISKRAKHPIVCQPGGTLSDYIPFYFTPFSPMLYNIKTGWGGIRQRNNDEIVIMVSSLRRLQAKKVSFLFTDRHAYLVAAQFYSKLGDLDQIDWDMLQRRDFRIDPEDPSKKERYQAEALIHKHLPVEALAGIVCYDEDVRKSMDSALAKRNQTMKVAKMPSWYF